MNFKNYLKKIIFLFALILNFSQFLTAQEKDVLEPVKIKESLTEITIFEIHTNVTGAEIYMNGVYQGRTNLIVTNYNPGFYFLEIRKEGYKTEKFSVEIKKDYHQTYSVDLKPIFGKLLIKNVPANPDFFIDGIRQNSVIVTEDNICELIVPVGTHNLLVRSFGYSEFQQSCEIVENENTEIFAEMKVSDFEIKYFEASAKVFNPEYKNRLGLVTFSFVVTGNEPVHFCIENESGEKVFEKDWQEFKNYFQFVTWNGKNSDGEKLPDGMYKASVESLHFIFEDSVEISSDFAYPIFNVSHSGSSIGKVPFLFKEFNNPEIGKSFFVPYLGFEPVFVLNSQKDETGFGAFKTLAGFDYDFLNHFEISVGADFYPGYDEKCTGLHSSFKGFNTLEIAENLNFDFGGIIRYGFLSAPFCGAGKIDTGAGLGFGAVAGLETPWISGDFSSVFVIGSESGKFGEKDNLWLNGFAFSVKPSKVVSINSYVELGNAQSLRTGAGVIFMPPKSSILMNFNCDYSVVFEESSYLSFEFMLSYLF